MSGRTPLRVTLVAAVVALAALALAVSGTVAAKVLHGYLQDRVDTSLDALAGQLRDPRLLVRVLQAPAVGGTDRADLLSTYYVRITSASLTGSSALAQGIAPPRLPARTAARTAPFTVRATSGHERWRALATVPPTGEGVLVVALPLHEVDSTVGRLVRVELVVGLVVLALLALLGHLAVRRSLRPLVAVETTAEAIAAGDLSRRVPESDPRTEVGRLSRAVNAMLGQIETAFHAREASESAARQSEDRMRRFVADASHELRTPLTSIRGFAELYRQGALQARPDVDRAMGRVESEAARMGVLVEDLLLLARLDQQRPLERQQVDLLELAGDAVHDARAVDPSRCVRLAVDAPDLAPVVTGDPARLRQVLGNLVGNALTHTPAGTPVTVRVGTRPGEAVLEVADAGPGVPAEERPRVFERFFRADTSRTRAQGGSGLGLSIVAALVAAHGGHVEVDDTPGGGATFRVRLPLAA